MNKTTGLVLATLITASFSGCAGGLTKLEDLYNETFGAVQDAEKLFDQAEDKLAAKKYDEAAAICDQIILKHKKTLTLSEKGVTTYGDVASRMKEEVLCLKRKDGQPVYATKAGMINALKAALTSADAPQIEAVLSCGIGRATVNSDHAIVFDTFALSQELAALRKQNGAAIAFSSTGTDWLTTQGYSDERTRRFAVAFDKDLNQWYVEALDEGTASEIAATQPAPLTVAPPVLTPAQQQQLRDDFALYTDPDGLVVSEPHPGINTSGNGLLYTSYYFMTLKLYGILSSADSQTFVQTVQACRKDGLNGLYNRAPTKTDQEGPDDYYGIASAAAQGNVNVRMASDIYQYGTNTKVGPINYIFNNETPGKFSFSAWLGRQPQLVAHIEMANAKRPAIWRRLVWMGGLALSKTSNPEGNQDIVLTWLQAANVGPRMRPMRLVAKDWKKRVLASYPNGMKDVFSIYFNNPNHPLAKWALTDFAWQY